MMVILVLIFVYIFFLFFIYKKYRTTLPMMINGKLFTNKIITPSFKESITKALFFYPELKDTKITFRTMKWKHFHSSAIPNPLTLFFPKKWRTYIIIISTQTKSEFVHGLLKNLPEKLQIGILGHELAHIVDYENKNFWQISKIIYYYLIPRKRKLFENSIDILAIKHGIGSYLHGFYSHFTSKNSHYTKKFMDNYLSDNEIKQLTKKFTGEDIS